jgi:hypothetical protein
MAVSFPARRGNCTVAFSGEVRKLCSPGCKGPAAIFKKVRVHKMSVPGTFECGISYDDVPCTNVTRWRVDFTERRLPSLMREAVVLRVFMCDEHLPTAYRPATE